MGKWNYQLQAESALSPGELPSLPIIRRLRGSQSRSGRYGEEKSLASLGNRTPVILPVARRYNEGAIRTPE
jgi:hypothetical protein